MKAKTTNAQETNPQGTPKQPVQPGTMTKSRSEEMSVHEKMMNAPLNGNRTFSLMR